MCIPGIIFLQRWQNHHPYFRHHTQVHQKKEGSSTSFLLFSDFFELLHPLVPVWYVERGNDRIQ